MSEDASNWRHRAHEIIFEADTPLGKAFDVGLILAILASVLVVMLDSVPPEHTGGASAGERRGDRPEQLSRNYGSLRNLGRQR